jgi:DNA (cytosine-5)-methyltransferase 1
MGYHLAGFDVVGVDIEPQPRYPFEFHKADALDKLADDGFLAQFHAVHGSPPCQSECNLRHRTGKTYPDLLGPTLRALGRLSVPWVVENVESTEQLPGELVLCGTEFGLRSGYRGYKFGPAAAREAMGIDWMTRAELSQAIPPSFTQFIGEQLIEHLAADRELVPQGSDRTEGSDG